MKIKINKQEILEGFTFDKENKSKDTTISHKSGADTKHLDDIKSQMDNESDKVKKDKLALKYQKAVSSYNKSKW